jgi:glycosyltransferase involved in cell wall biosynthesis
MSNGLPVVFIFGGSGRDLRSAGPAPDVETQELDCRHFATDEGLAEALASCQPQAIVTFGDAERFQNLYAAPYMVRRRWIHLDEEPSPEDAGERALHCFLDDALRIRPRETTPPLVSVFTPVYRPGDRILRPYRSLLAQSYPEWEWILLDDSDDDGTTWRQLNELAKKDFRISIYRQHRHSGNIGELKNKLGHLAQGEFVLELDHDDELAPDALRWTVDAFRRFPQAGFAYSDWSEVFEDGRNAVYPDGWAFGFGSSHLEKCQTVDGNRELVVHNAPAINPKTIRHIVSAPNHLRAWRRDFYLAIGGHNRKIHVADDFEICIRTFLHTRMVRIRGMAYVQYYNAAGNTQRLRNKEIQRLVTRLRSHYDRAIHDRFSQLAINDFCWNAQLGRSDFEIPNPAASYSASANFIHIP